MMKKRRYGVLLAGLLCICMVASLPVLAETGEGSASPDAGGQAVFELSYPSELPAVGETFEVTVSLKNNPGFGAIQFDVTSNNSIVEYVNSSPGSILSGALGAANVESSTNAIIAAASFEPIFDDGEVGIVECKVLEKGNPSFTINNVVFSNVFGKALPYLIMDSSDEQKTSDYPSVTPVIRPEEKPSDQSSDLPSDRPDDDPATPPTDQPGSSPTTPSPGQPGGSSAENPGGSSPVAAPDETAPVRYNDITEVHWAYDYVYRATAAGLFNGFPDGGFHPDENVTRAQFITVLWRMSHSPAPGAETSVQFTDTPSGEYYYDAVRWGVDNNLINGVENPDGTFSYLPNATITREQVMTILFRYDGEKSGMESLFTTTYDSQFTDSADIADYAKKAMYWAYYKTYISGTSATTLSPKGLATRAQISKILVEYLTGNQE